MSNIIDKEIFKQISGHTFEALANKLINTTSKEENQILTILTKTKKLNEKDETSAFYDYRIQPSNGPTNLIDAINLILDFNETIQLDLV